MLNLEKLEEKLDLALAKESEESLTSWLLDKRSKSFLLQLGLGEIVSQSSFQNTFALISSENPTEINTNCVDFSAGLSSFAMAA